MRLNRQNQSALALIIWIVFLNTELMFFVVAMLKWRVDSPKVPLDQIVMWDPALMRGTAGLAVLTVCSLLASVGLGLGIRFYQGLKAAPPDEKPRPPVLLILSFILLETVGIIGLVFGMIQRNITLAIPFLGGSAALIAILVPLGSRFPRGTGGDGGARFPASR